MLYYSVSNKKKLNGHKLHGVEIMFSFNDNLIILFFPRFKIYHVFFTATPLH